MAESASSTATSPWIYFLSGALLPTIAHFVLTQQRRWKNSSDDGDDLHEDEDDDDSSIDEDLPRSTNTSASTWGMRDAPYKMVLVVNQELKMGKGKIAAQCGHASVGCYKRSSKACPAGLRAWEHTGCAKIAVKCPTSRELREIYQTAHERGLPMYLVEDAGRTQIAAGSRTVLGILGPTRVFDGLSSHLKLL